MSGQQLSGFYDWLRARLAEKEYTELGPVQPLEIAFFKHGALGLPYIVGVVDTGGISNTPTEIFQMVEQWLQKMIGNTGAGVLLFIYHSAPAVTTIEEIQKIGSGAVGSGQVIAGAHDLRTGRHWLSNHMGWEQEIYDD